MKIIKQIDALINGHDSEDLLGFEGALEIIKELVNEAKKDFPNYNNILQKEELRLPDDFPSLEYSRDVIAWFKKWF